MDERGDACQVLRGRRLDTQGVHFGAHALVTSAANRLSFAATAVLFKTCLPRDALVPSSHRPQADDDA